MQPFTHIMGCPPFFPLLWVFIRLRTHQLPTNIIYGIASIVLAIFMITRLSKRRNLDLIPTVGSSSWLGSWWAGFKYLTDAQTVIQEGYEKHRPGPFKVAEPNRWMVIITDRKHVEEVAKASDSELSLSEAANDRFQLEHILGREVHYNPYHTDVIRHRLMRNIEVLYPEIRDEIIRSFSEVLDLEANEWKSVPALSIVQKVICRTSNRVFVGLPLCRNSDWIDLNIQCSVDMIQGCVVIRLFPKFMRSLATRFLTKIPWCIARGVSLLGPIVEERQKYLKEYGAEWDDKPNDLLSWLMDEAEGLEMSAERLIARMLLSNFASIHSSSNSFTMMLFYLATNPQYVQPLREEVEGAVETDGWSKAGLGKMRKVESFLKECQRIGGLDIVTLTRKVMKDFTFSDGTFLPKDTMIAAATLALHHDKDIYENPDVFEPFRFAGECQDDKVPKHLFASTSVDYLPFGHGRRACPGRLFTSVELKLMLAHVVVTYDVKLDANMTRSHISHISTFAVPNLHAKIVFRNRVN